MTSPSEIADTLRLPPPTPQQEAIIAAELGPALVIAGAGSGKTETMAARVLWLLANGHVQPSQILGLTFTRKAAGELSARVAERIGQLAATPLFQDQYDPLEAPTIATYNSYANALYRDNAIVLGRESDGTVLGDAAAWQLARSVLVRSEHSALADLDRNLDPIVDAVLSLSRAMAENMVEGDEVREFARRFAGVAELPPGGTGNYAETNAYLGVLRQIGAVAALETLTAIAAEYDAEKVRRGLVEYSDQVASALRILQKQPALAAEQREQYRVVLLDEYQDTSVVQTRLLSTLFAGSSGHGGR